MCAKTIPIRLVLPGYGKAVEGEDGENSLPGGWGELKSGPESGIPQVCLGPWTCWLAS